MNTQKIFLERLANAKTVLISTHLYPDADGIGSQIALCMALRDSGRTAYCVNEEELLDRYKYLDPDNVVHSVKEFKAKDLSMNVDLFIIVDTNSPDRIGKKAQTVMSHSKRVLFIDHHPCPPEIMVLHCVDTSKAATGQLVGELIHSLKIPFTKELALPLYTSILIDTSSFRYPTVTGDTHRLLAKLLDTGIRPPNAYNKIYGTKRLLHMHFLGKVLSSARTSDDGKIAWITVTEKLIEEYESDPEDTHAFINHLLVLDNVKIACMFRDIGKNIKISFRSAGDVDVGVMAQALGGGGHNHSAATVVEGHLRTVIKEIVPKLELMLKSAQRDS